MENSMRLNDELLWDYVDGFLSPDAAQSLENLLRDAPAWQQRLVQIRQDKQALANMGLENPEIDLAGNVMRALRQEGLIGVKTDRTGNTWVLWLSAGILSLLMGACLITLVILAGQQSFTIAAPTFPVEALLDVLSMPAIHYSLYLAATFGLLQFLDKFLLQRKSANLIRS